MEDPCVICLGDMHAGDVEFTPCAHAFHRECISEWLKIKQQCPICKTNIRGAGSTGPSGPAEPAGPERKERWDHIDAKDMLIGCAALAATLLARRLDVIIEHARRNERVISDRVYPIRLPDNYDEARRVMHKYAMRNLDKYNPAD